MNTETEEIKYSAQELRQIFDEALGKQLDRLMFTRFGLGALLLDLATISCLVLLAERENKIKSSPDDAPDRFTEETFITELAEIGLDADEDVKATLHDLFRKGYIDIDDDDRYHAEEPALDTAKKLDKIFPSMPGISLVAYFAQTLSEVASNRKGLKDGISQFVQTLQTQGVPLNKKKGAKQRKKKQETLPKTGFLRPTESRIIRDEEVKGREIYSLSPSEPSPEHTPETKDPSSDAVTEQSEVEGVGGAELLGEEKVLAEPVQGTGSPGPGTADEIEGENPQLEGATPEPVPSPQIQETQEGPQVAGENLEAPSSEAGAEAGDLEEKPVEEDTAPSEDDVRGDQNVSEKTELEQDFSGKPSSQRVENDIEERIATFEEDLAMQCPVCKRGKILKEATAKGKYYYKCADRDCGLISWGKPYHEVCPRCHNPFLVESSNRDGTTILKCPRATCRHWQNLPGQTPSGNQETGGIPLQTPVTATPLKPRRKVKKRRVVRKKR